MRRVTLVLVTVLLSAAPLYAQNLCTAPPPAGVFFNPDKMYVTLPEQTLFEADGVTSRVNDYQVAWFAQGANPATATPVAGPTTVVKTAFTLVTGTTDCYMTTPLVPPVPVGSVALVGAIKARRTGTATIPAAESLWSVLSNSFAQAPTVLLQPGPPTLKR